MDFAGNLVACRETRLPAPPASPEEAANVARTLFASLGPASQWPSLAAVGVSVPGTVDNESGRVLEKIGMQKEGILRENGADNTGALRDVVVYSVLKSEFLPD